MARDGVFMAAIYFISLELFILSTAVTVPYYPSHAETNRLEQNRLSLLDWQSYRQDEPEGPGTYAFGYDIEEPQKDNVQYRHEERHANGSVTGSYGFVTPDGSVHIVNYIADQLGYRANTETRLRGVLKPVIVNEERDIADAIAAANYAKRKGDPFGSTEEQRVRPWDQRFNIYKTNSHQKDVYDTNSIYNGIKTNEAQYKSVSFKNPTGW